MAGWYQNAASIYYLLYSATNVLLSIQSISGTHWALYSVCARCIVGAVARHIRFFNGPQNEPIFSPRPCPRTTVIQMGVHSRWRNAHIATSDKYHRVGILWTAWGRGGGQDCSSGSFIIPPTTPAVDSAVYLLCVSSRLRAPSPLPTVC